MESLRKGWIVGVNAPGFLPDNEPTPFGSYVMASFGLQWELVKTRELLREDPDEEADRELQRAADEVAESARAKGPVSVEFLGLVHWLEGAEDSHGR